jgi:hypothetical protein
VAGPRLHRPERPQLGDEYAAFDAELRFEVPGVRVADPKACQCGEVLKGVHQAVGVQGVRHGVHARDAHRHLHGLLRGRLRRLLQLRPPRTTCGAQRAHGGDAMTDTSARDLTEQDVLDKIEKAVRRAPRFTDERITMAHGAGGKASRAH